MTTYLDAVERKPLKRSVKRHDNGFSVGVAFDKRSAAAGGERVGNDLPKAKTFAYKRGKIILEGSA